MRKIGLIGSVALLAITAPSYAQQGGGMLGGARTGSTTNAPAPTPTPAPRPTPAPSTQSGQLPANQRYSTAYYLNGGDAVSANTIRNLREEYRSPQYSEYVGFWGQPYTELTDAPVGVNVNRTSGYERYLRQFSGAAPLQEGDTNRDEVQVLRATNYQGLASRSDIALGAPGTRPVSNLERIQAATLQQSIDLYDARIHDAQILIQRATRAGDPVALPDAQSLYRNLQGDRQLIQDSLDFMNRANGRSFQNDASADYYLNHIEGTIDVIRGRESMTNE